MKIAEGGFGGVYSAKHPLRGMVAYKQLKTAIIKDRSKLVQKSSSQKNARVAHFTSRDIALSLKSTL